MNVWHYTVAIDGQSQEMFLAEEPAMRRDSDEYRNLSHVRKVNWLRGNPWRIAPFLKGRVHFGDIQLENWG